VSTVQNNVLRGLVKQRFHKETTKYAAKSSGWFLTNQQTQCCHGLQSKPNMNKYGFATIMCQSVSWKKKAGGFF